MNEPNCNRCIYRMHLSKQNELNLQRDFKEAFSDPTSGAKSSGPTIQTFKHGLCSFLTRDESPVECLQPDSNEKNCLEIN